MPRAEASPRGCTSGDPIAIRSTLHVLRAAVTGAVASDRGGLHASVDLGGGDLALPKSATALAGLEAHARPEAADWLSGMMQWVTGAPAGPLPEHHAELPLRAWALLHEGGPLGFDALHLAQAVPRGEAWVVALSPERFAAQAVARLGQESTPHANRMRARLERPSANLSTVQKLIETAALSLEAGAGEASPALRLRLGCSDTAAAFQAAVVLQAWRARRAGGTDAAASAFARAHVQRGATRVELTFPGTLPQLLALLPPPR